MAKYFRLFLLLACLLSSSCQEGGEAGDLFGQWRMTGTDNKYLSFAGSLVLFKSINEGEVYGTFQHKGDSLFIRCYSVYGTPADTAIVENTFGLKPFNDIRLKILTLNDDRLVIGKDGKNWDFYKY